MPKYMQHLNGRRLVGVAVEATGDFPLYAIWHLFVLGGSISHYFSVLGLLG